ncbi:MAG: hypothetical protein KDB79_00165 [Acidobacteria bacterium]|nr:hypothetical protein [Acidobacteriota bacterium]
MSLKDSILKWNGKSKDEIGIIYNRFSIDAEFLPKVFELSQDEATEIGATWLLKKHLEMGNTLSVRLTEDFYSFLHKPVNWEAKLHLLQCIPRLSIPSSGKAEAETFIRNCLSSKNKFVRAWAYGGFCKLADEHPEYRDEARQLVDFAMTEESASVKARIRNVVKDGFF